MDTLPTVKALTKPQCLMLWRISHYGPSGWCRGLGRAGGAASRMMDRLKDLGFLGSGVGATDLTPRGRAAVDHWFPKPTK